jgi:succinoglycan biosynthesis transport protein ExoP
MTGLMELLATIRSKFLILAVWALIGAAAAGGINLLLPVVYEANARILVAAPYWNDSTALADPNIGGGTLKAYGDEFTQQRMTSYVRLVTTPMVAGPVAQRLQLGESGEELAKKLSGHIVPDTVVIQVRAQDSSPVRAAAIADAAAQQTISVIKDVERPPYTTVSPIQPILTEPASVPNRPISPRTLLNIISGAIVGFLLGLTYVAAYAGLRETRMLKRCRDDGDFTGEHANVLGVLSAEDHLSLDEVPVDAKLLRLEIARRLTEADIQSFVVASPRATPTTGVFAALLATALTEAGSPTVVVYADFAAEYDSSTVGLGDLLGTPAALDTAVQFDERSGVSWIPAGAAPENPTRELTGSKMRDVLAELGDRYRHVIVVSPAVLESADAVDMASQVGASILIDPVSQTSVDELRESERLLGLSRGRCLGRVVVAGRTFSRPVETSQMYQRRLAA